MNGRKLSMDVFTHSEEQSHLKQSRHFSPPDFWVFSTRPEETCSSSSVNGDRYTRTSAMLGLMVVWSSASVFSWSTNFEYSLSRVSSLFWKKKKRNCGYLNVGAIHAIQQFHTRTVHCNLNSGPRNKVFRANNWNTPKSNPNQHVKQEWRNTSRNVKKNDWRL